MDKDKVWAVDATALNFLKKLDSTDCSLWVLERLEVTWCNQFKFLVFDNIKRVFSFAFIQVNIYLFL